MQTALVIAGVVLVETGHDTPADEPDAEAPAGGVGLTERTETAEIVEAADTVEAAQAVKEIR